MSQSQNESKPSLGPAWIRPARVGLLVCVLFYLASLFFLKASWLKEYSSKKLEVAQVASSDLFNLFHSSYYFYFEDQFKPGIQKFLQENPELKKVVIVSATGQVVFNSDDLMRPGGGVKTQPYRAEGRIAQRPQDPELVPNEPIGIGVLTPSGQYSLYLAFSIWPVLQKLIFCASVGLIALFTLWIVLGSPILIRAVHRARARITKIRIHALRTQFIGAILSVNLITGAIIFTSQSHLQHKDHHQRLVRNSVLLAELSTDQVISNFNDYFYFYFSDKFVPAIRQLLAGRENLNRVRIIAKKTMQVVFDSADMPAAQLMLLGGDTKAFSLSQQALAELKQKNVFSEEASLKSGTPYLHVLTTYRNDSGEAPFLVEYFFSFASLTNRIGDMRLQIVKDLIPSMLLGILVALLFAQIVVGPVKALSKATRLITSGNYDVNLSTNKKDELGDLVRAFNGMASELKRKNELKKYLSDHSYRKIVEAPEGLSTLGGSRVRATILFCDIRNFVTTCESMDAEEVTSMLNGYFSSMVEVIYKHRGEIDKFIGDAILAVFYEQEDTKQPVNTALHAIYCAMEMRERLKDFNARRSNLSKTPIEIGIGINSGEIISGPIGSPDRMDFTVIGDVVNLANRVEKLSKNGKHTRVVFTQHVEQRIRGLLEYEEMSRDSIRGKSEDVIVYELVRIKNVENLLVSLDSPDPEVKRHCIELLGYSRNPSVMEALYEKLADSDDNVRISTVTAIARLAIQDQVDAIEVLFKHLEREHSEKVTSNIIMALGKLCTTERLLPLKEYLFHKNERIVANAIEALGALESVLITDALVPFLGSRNNRVKANAAMVLFAKGKVEVIDSLKPMLLHTDPLMRASAAFALGELTAMTTAESIAEKIRGDDRKARHFLGELQGCVPMLVSLLKDTDPMVKRQAIVALGKLKDKSAVLPLLDNISFETDNKELVREVADALRSIGSHRLVRDVVRQLV